MSREGPVPGMSSLERPKLRPVMPRRVEHQGQSFVLLQDPTGVVTEPILLPLDGFQHVVRHFDGQSSLIDIQGKVLRQTGLFLALTELTDLVRRLDAAMILDGPTFAAFHQSYRESGRRPAALGGPILRGDAPFAPGAARAVFRRLDWRRSAASRWRERQRRAFAGS